MQAGTKSKLGHIQIEIQCGGVTVAPEEIVFADENGIIIMNETELFDILTIAEKIQYNENVALTKIENGESLIEMFNFKEHWNNVLARKESFLKWNV